MSRVGKSPIAIPEKVSINVADNGAISVEGPKGKLSWSLPVGLAITQQDGQATVERHSEERQIRAMHGTTQRLLSNMVKGVSDGFRKDLEIHGVGFRASVKGDKLDLSLGQSHPRLHPIPAGITVTVADNTKIAIEGIDKQVVGQVASDIRSYYPPEPYKGKGVRYAGEQVRRKAGKSVK